MAERKRDRKTLLAAEYVLGVMPERARRRFERVRDADAALCAEAEAWETRLAPLADTLQPVSPPSRLEQAILARISAPQRGRWPRGGRFWTGFAAGGALAASIALAWVGLDAMKPDRQQPSTRTVAVLLGEKAEPALIIHHTEGIAALVVEAAEMDPPPSRHAYELWVVAPGAAPHSLGLVPARGTVEIPLDETEVAALAPGAVLAVSVEPEEGAPPSGPTGPVHYKGPVIAPERP